MTTPTKPKVEVKSVKHDFTTDEHRQLGGDLARCISSLRGIEAEFDQVKASYKSKTTEAEARIDKISTDITNGFEMRNERCVVVLDVKESKKHFYLESALVKGEIPKGLEPVITEPLTDADRQTELLEAESKFDAREDIELFSPTESDSGILTVGRLGGKWFSALRIKIGTRVINERLDSEQACSKKRPDQIKRACKRFVDWVEQNLGREEAKGFKNQIELVKAEHAEREE